MNFNQLVLEALGKRIGKHTYEVLGITDVEKDRKGKILVTFYELRIDGQIIELSDSHEPGKYKTLGDYYFVGPGAHKFIDKYSSKEYDEILNGAKKAVEAWKLIQRMKDQDLGEFDSFVNTIF
ncbi:MAG: hypothetical protein EB127_21290 [Alphaproteobacteria bacterium]|nr:hypothetical protein [Alphaproteobacteria bacterium]